MLIGYVSDQDYAAIADALAEFRGAADSRFVLRSAASGALLGDLPPGPYEICLSKQGFGSKRVHAQIGVGPPIHFRLLGDRLLGYAWPKWCRGGDRVEFRVHTVEPYKLGLWRYGYHKEFIGNI